METTIGLQGKIEGGMVKIAPLEIARLQEFCMGNEGKRIQFTVCVAADDQTLRQHGYITRVIVPKYQQIFADAGTIYSLHRTEEIVCEMYITPAFGCDTIKELDKRQTSALISTLIANAAEMGYTIPAPQ